MDDPPKGCKMLDRNLLSSLPSPQSKKKETQNKTKRRIPQKANEMPQFPLAIQELYECIVGNQTLQFGAVAHLSGAQFKFGEGAAMGWMIEWKLMSMTPTLHT